MLTTSTKYLPLWIMIGYIAFGILCSLFGPLQFVDYQYETMLVFMGSVVLCMCIGYHFGMNHDLALDSSAPREALSSAFRLQLRGCFALSGLIITFIIFTTFLAKGINLNIFKSGEAYVDLYTAYERNTGTYSLVFLVTSLGAPFLFISTIWGLYYFFGLNRYLKMLVIYMLLGTFIVFTIGDGKQKQFGDLVIYFACIYTMKKASAGRLDMRLFNRIALLGAGGMVMLLVLLNSRYSAVNIDAANLNAVLHPLIVFDENHWLIRQLGPGLGFPVAMLSSYFGQGYYGLSLALREPFVWTGMTGSSYSVSVITNLLGGPFMVEQSYPYMVGETFGWSQDKWHTAYAWLASDLTWPGTALMTGVVSYIYAVAWKEAVVIRNPYAILVFCMLSIGAAYLPANNQLMHSPGALLTLIVVFGLYYRHRGMVNYHNLISRSRRSASRQASATVA